MKVVLLSSDMLVASRLRSTAERAGVTLGIAVNESDLASRLTDDTQLVIFDLSQIGLQLPPAIATVRATAPAARVMAFGPHVEEELLAGAKIAGCDEVLSNGQFHREQAAILAKYAGG